MFSAEEVLLPLQRLQQAHDERSHRDILSFDLYDRLKHMVLHFYKYAGKIEAARPSGDADELRRTLLDAFIICMASANSLNVSLGESMAETAEAGNIDSLAQSLAKKLRAPDLYACAVSQFVLIGGKMAKAIESADHMEIGNPRADMNALIPKMCEVVLGLLGHLPGGIEADVRSRLEKIESKSVLLRPFANGAR